jgi:hypothetical protein
VPIKVWFHVPVDASNTPHWGVTEGRLQQMLAEANTLMGKAGFKLVLGGVNYFPASKEDMTARGGSRNGFTTRQMQLLGNQRYVTGCPRSLVCVCGGGEKVTGKGGVVPLSQVSGVGGGIGGRGRGAGGGGRLGRLGGGGRRGRIQVGSMGREVRPSGQLLVVSALKQASKSST